MIKCFCDRCENEINEKQYENMPFLSTYSPRDEIDHLEYDFIKHRKLCNSCMQKYYDFMNGKILIDERGNKNET